MSIPYSNIYSVSSYNIYFNCSSNNISSIASFGVSSSFSNEILNQNICSSATTLNKFSLDSGCIIDNWLNSKILPLCIGKQVCNISINTTELSGECKPNYTNRSNFYLSYACYSKI